MVARQHHDFTDFRFSSLLFVARTSQNETSLVPNLDFLQNHIRPHSLKFGMTRDWFLGVLSQILTLMVSCPSNQAGMLQFAFRMLPLNRFQFIAAAPSCCVKGGDSGVLPTHSPLLFDWFGSLCLFLPPPGPLMFLYQSCLWFFLSSCSSWCSPASSAFFV